MILEWSSVGRSNPHHTHTCPCSLAFRIGQGHSHWTNLAGNFPAKKPNAPGRCYIRSQKPLYWGLSCGH